MSKLILVLITILVLEITGCGVTAHRPFNAKMINGERHTLAGQVALSSLTENTCQSFGSFTIKRPSGSPLSYVSIYSDNPSCVADIANNAAPCSLTNQVHCDLDTYYFIVDYAEHSEEAGFSDGYYLQAY